MSAPQEVWYDENGWYYEDYDGWEHGPFETEESAHLSYARYVAQQGSCPTCKGD